MKKKTKLTLQEAKVLVPSFLKLDWSKNRIKKLNVLLYGFGRKKRVFKNTNKNNIPIDLRRSYCYRGVSWFPWRNGINHRSVRLNKKLNIFVFLCLKEECSEKWIDIASGNNNYFYCSSCRDETSNDHYWDDFGI